MGLAGAFVVVEVVVKGAEEDGDAEEAPTAAVVTGDTGATVVDLRISFTRAAASS